MLKFFSFAFRNLICALFSFSKTLLSLVRFLSKHFSVLLFQNCIYVVGQIRSQVESVLIFTLQVKFVIRILPRLNMHSTLLGLKTPIPSLKLCLTHLKTPS